MAEHETCLGASDDWYTPREIFDALGSVGAAPGHGVVLIGMGAIACGALGRSRLGLFVDRRGQVYAS